MCLHVPTRAYMCLLVPTRIILSHVFNGSPGPECDSTTAYFRDNDRSWLDGKMDPLRELNCFGSDVVYSWPLICEEYAGVSEYKNGEGYEWGTNGEGYEWGMS